MNETEFYHKKVSPWSNKHGEHSRVENTAESGMPDMNCCWGYFQFWLELKVIKGGKLYFEKYQIPWISRRYKQFGDTGMWVLAWDNKTESLRMYQPSNILSAIRTVEKKWVTVQVEDLMNLVKPNASQFEQAAVVIWKGASISSRCILDHLNGI